MPWPKSSISLSMTSPRPFDLGDAVADLADDADGLLGGRGLGARDLRFDFLDQVSHRSSHLVKASQPCLERRQPGAHAAVVDVAADLIRMPPMSAGFSSNDVVESRAVHAREAGLDVRRAGRRRSGVALSTTAVCRSRSSRTSRWKSDKTAQRAAAADAASRCATWRTRASSSAPSTRQSRNSCRARVAFGSPVRALIARLGTPLAGSRARAAAWPSPRRGGGDRPASGSCRSPTPSSARRAGRPRA